MPAAAAPFDSQAFTAANGIQCAYILAFGRLGTNALVNYLPGLRIGKKLQSQSLLSGEIVLVFGADALSARYAQALKFAGVSAQVLPASVIWVGLWCIAQIV